MACKSGGDLWHTLYSLLIIEDQQLDKRLGRQEMVVLHSVAICSTMYMQQQLLRPASNVLVSTDPLTSFDDS